MWLLASAPELLAPPIRARFEIVLVDDAVDPFDLGSEAALPSGVTLHQESLRPRGVEGDPVSRYFVQVEPQSGETLSQAVKRLQPWLDTIALPPTARIAWERRESLDETSGQTRFFGWRSYVLSGAPVITTRDVASAQAIAPEGDETALGLRFTPDGGERFRLATRDHLRQRMAIVLNGRVCSAPLISSEIKGGHVQIFLGGEPANSRAAAQAALEELRAEPPP